MPGRLPSSSLMVRDWRYQSSASSRCPRSWATHPELVVGDGHAGAVAELLLDGEGLAGTSPRRRRGVPAVLGDDPELVVGDGHAGPVAELLLDREGFAVPVLGVVQAPARLGDHAELVVGGGEVASAASEMAPGGERVTNARGRCARCVRGGPGFVFAIGLRADDEQPQRAGVPCRGRARCRRATRLPGGRGRPSRVPPRRGRGLSRYSSRGWAIACAAVQCWSFERGPEQRADRAPLQLDDGSAKPGVAGPRSA